MIGIQFVPAESSARRACNKDKRSVIRGAEGSGWILSVSGDSTVSSNTCNTVSQGGSRCLSKHAHGARTKHLIIMLIPCAALY